MSPRIHKILTHINRVFISVLLVSIFFANVPTKIMADDGCVDGVSDGYTDCGSYDYTWDVNAGNINTTCPGCSPAPAPTPEPETETIVSNNTTCPDGSVVTAGTACPDYVANDPPQEQNVTNPAPIVYTAQPVVYTTSYNNYTNNSQAPTYVPTNWGTPTAPRAVTYKPVVVNTVVQNTNTSTYTPTNWNITGPALPATPRAVTYNPVVTNTVVQTNPTTYTPTNWNITGGTSQTYAPVTQTQKLCQNGKMIPVNETCYKTCSGNVGQVPETYNCPVFSPSSVVTTIPTQITTNSARCNAMAIINNNQNYVGYFEYGVSQSLGQTTNQANIGSSQSVSFSNVISGLNSNKTYYCRAVISNQNSIYKGQIQQFTTKGETTKYVPPVIQTTTVVKKEETITKIVDNKKVVTKVPVVTPKKVVICQDVEGNKTELTEGDKFVKIEVSKSGIAVPGKDIEYKVSYKNESTINLKNAYIKLSIPKEYKYIGSIGKVEGSDIVLDIGQIKASESQEKTFLFSVNQDAKLGVNVVSSAYVYYEMLDKDGKDVSDENSAYMITTVVSESEEKQVSTGFFGSDLFKWLAIIALFIIMILLGRNIYTHAMHERHKKQVLGAHH